MRHFEIRDPLSLRQFRRGFETRSGLPLELTYLEASQVIGFADRRGEIIGGYVLRAGAPRCFSFIRDQNLRRRLETDFPHTQTLEVTCLWMDREVRSVWQRVWIYLWMYRDVAVIRPKFLVSCSTLPALQRLHMIMLKQQLFDGHWDGTTKKGLIYGGDTKHLRWNFVVALCCYVVQKIKPGVRRVIHPA